MNHPNHPGRDPRHIDAHHILVLAERYRAAGAG